MKFTKWILKGTSAVVLAGLVLALLAPKAAHAVAATAVQVVNSSSSPVPNLDVERNARIPYQSTQTVACQPQQYYCQVPLTAVPAGYRLVVQDVSASFSGAGYSPPIAVLNGIGTPLQVYLTGGVAISLGGSLYQNNLHQTATAYFDAGTQPYVEVLGSYSSGGNGAYNLSATLVGYMENCAVSSCPAIQQ
jgi:hypothetical protein